MYKKDVLKILKNLPDNTKEYIDNLIKVVSNKLDDTDLYFDEENNKAYIKKSDGTLQGTGMTLPTGGGNISDDIISEKTTWSSSKIKQELNNMSNSIDVTYDETNKEIIVTSNRVSYDEANKQIILS